MDRPLQGVPDWLRAMLRRPARTLAMASFLGACLAFNAAVFAVVDGTIFKPMPFPNADRLVVIGTDLRPKGATAPGPVSRLQTEDLRDAPGIEALVAWTGGAIASDRSAEEGIRSVSVTRGFFEHLGATPRLGRTLVAEDVPAPGEVPVVIGDRLWRARLGAKSSVVNSRVWLGGISCRVVGVAPPGFEFPSGANVWSLLGHADARSRAFKSLSAIARLSPGAGCPVSVGDEPLHCASVRKVFSPRNAWAFVLVLVAATALTVMTWVQVSCLELARSLTRAREMGVRLSMGATRLRVAIDAVWQGVVIGLAALTVCALVLPSLLSALLSVLPADVSRGQPITTDLRVLAFAAVLAVGAVIAMVGMPVQALMRVDATRLLRGTFARTPKAGVIAPWLIVAVQVSLSTGLVYVTGLATRSMWLVSRVDFGYNPANVVAIRLPGDAYLRATARLESLSSVAAVAGSGGRPLGGPATLVGVASDAGRLSVQARMVTVTPAYFRALGVPLVGGREFTPSDTRGSGLVVIVNAPLARRLGLDRWSEQRRLRLLGHPARIVGLVGDPVLTRPDDGARETVFVPTAQWTPPSYILVRAGSGPRVAAQAMHEIAAAMRDVAPAGSYSLFPLGEEARRATANYRSRMVLLLAIGAVGLVLCFVGVYGAVTFAWTRMRRTLAVRMALGGTPWAIRRHLLGTAMRWGLPGVTAGAVFGMLAGRVGQAFLFGVVPVDAVALAAAAFAVGLACAAASLPPLILAGRIEPSSLLRDE